MTARFAKDQMSFVMPSSFSSAETVRPNSFRAGPGLAARVAAAAKWLLEMPRRRAVLEELSALSDHELSDIGLNRADLSRVFDPQFAADRRPAL